MKDILIRNEKIVRDTTFSKRLEFLLRDKFKKSALWIKGVDSFTDIKYNDRDFPVVPRQKNLSQAFIHYSVFMADYINLILFNNELAEQRKSGPYDIFLNLTVDTEDSKAKIHIYLDSDIFGLIAGARYTNLINIVRASFPIFSKIGFEVELKLFSLREEQKEPKNSFKSRAYRKPTRTPPPQFEEEYSDFGEDESESTSEEDEEEALIYSTEEDDNES